MENKLGITDGTIFIETHTHCFGLISDKTQHIICDTFTKTDTDLKNINLYCDAHNTANKCNKLPSQILQENEELKQHLIDLLSGEKLSLTAKTFTEQLLTKIDGNG